MLLTVSFEKTAYGAVGLDMEHFGIVGTHHEYFSSAVGACGYIHLQTQPHDRKGVGRNQHSGPRSSCLTLRLYLPFPPPAYSLPLLHPEAKNKSAAMATTATNVFRMFIAINF